MSVLERVFRLAVGIPILCLGVFMTLSGADFTGFCLCAVSMLPILDATLS